MGYHYSVRTGYERAKTNTKKYIFSILAAVAVISGATAPALAIANSYCGSSATGCDAAAAAGAQCNSGAASGSFGAFGPGSDWRGGANGPATGLSNSGVCGNRP